ncbi:MAG: hypothetical protein PF795_11305 [Kiritimatiellae bacterium]|nr:hypothetical protein [Kiritimatiellia bacterium]
MNDPIVEEVRANRMAHTRKFNGNLKLICEYLRQIQQEFPQRIVQGAPKRILPTKPSSEHADARQTG